MTTLTPGQLELESNELAHTHADIIIVEQEPAPRIFQTPADDGKRDRMKYKHRLVPKKPKK